MPFRRIAPLAILLAGAAPAFAQTGGGEPASRISNRILSALVEANGVPGMGASIWRDGRIVWTGSAGRRDLARNLAVDENTVFRFASVSKIFAVTAAARLRQEGRLDVDAPAATIISGLNPSWAPFNARQLAAHISGMPHYQMPLDAAVGDAPVISMRDAIAIAANRALLTPPAPPISIALMATPCWARWRRPAPAAPISTIWRRC